MIVVRPTGADTLFHSVDNLNCRYDREKSILFKVLILNVRLLPDVVLLNLVIPLFKLIGLYVLNTVGTLSARYWRVNLLSVKTVSILYIKKNFIHV